MNGIVKGISVMVFGALIILYGRSGEELPIPFLQFSSDKSRRMICTVFGGLIVFVGFCGMFFLD